MTGPAFQLACVGAALILTGIIWWHCERVSAECPASLLVMFGAGFIGAGWWVS